MHRSAESKSFSTQGIVYHHRPATVYLVPRSFTQSSHPTQILHISQDSHADHTCSPARLGWGPPTARGLAVWIAGSSAQDCKCYTITAPRPGSFRFMPLNPRFGNAIMMFTSTLVDGGLAVQLRSNHTELSCSQGYLPGRSTSPPTGSSPWCPCPCACCCCCQLLPMKQRRLSPSPISSPLGFTSSDGSPLRPRVLLVASADLRCLPPVRSLFYNPSHLLPL